MPLRILLICTFFFSFKLIGFAQPTVINRGDLAVLGVNAAYNGTSRDEISFVCFKDITPGTEIQILDAGYGNCINGFWSGGQEGGAKITRTNTTLPKGTVVTFRTDPFAFANPDNNWTVTDLYVHLTNPNFSILQSNFNINSTGDQLYIAQGGTWTEQTSQCTINGNRTSPNAIFPGNNGRILFGFSTNGWQANAGAQSSGESMLYPGMNCFSMSPTNGTSWNKYNGPFTAATLTQWIDRISNKTNWQTYSSSNNYNSNGQNYVAGYTLNILTGGDIPTATWTAPTTTICSNTAPINLNNFITGTIGGTWSGTGVTGNTFNPAGLNGAYNITYTVNYVSGGNSCPIAQTSTINVATGVAPTATGLYNLCQNETATALTATGNNLLWYTQAIGGTGNSTAPIPNTTIVGTTNYYVSQTVNGCESERTLIRVNVNASPSINAITNQAVCVNTLTSGINFSGTGLATYNWTNNNPSIGLAASGSGNIAAFTALNNGNTPITATITATPVSTGYAYIPNYGTVLAPGNTVSVINTSTNTVVGNIIVGGSPFGVAVNNDGSRVYVSNYRTNSLSVINTFTNVVTNTINVGGNLPMGVAVHPDGSKVYVTNQLSNTVSVINATTNTLITSIPVSLQPQGITVSPDGTKVYVANVNSNNITVINTATNAILGVIGVGTQPITVALSPDGSRLYVPNYGNNNISVINTTNNTVITTIATGTNPNGVAVSPDGTRVYVTNQNSANVTVIDATNNTVVATIGVNNNPQGISITSDGTKAYVCNFGSNNVSVINTATNAVIATVAVGSVPHSLGNFLSPSNGCSGAPISFDIIVNPKPIATISYTGSPFCATGNATPTITGVNNGTFSSTSGLQINATSGIIDLANSTPGTYVITYSFSANGCSNTTTSTIVIQPAFTSTPTITTVQPTCTLNTGSITVTSPTGTGFSYSINGTTFQSSNTFNNLTAHNYAVTVKNSNGCISSPINVTINAVPNTPSIPAFNITQPTCVVPVGSLTVTSPIGAGLTYSIDGTNYQTSTTFNNIPPNSYTLTVKNAAGCTNSATFTIQASNTGTTPTFNITQPSCSSTTVVLTFISPIGTNFNYSIDGTNFQASPTFNNVPAGTYTLVVKDINTNCLLSAGTRTININSTQPPAPTATTNVQYCRNATATALSATGSNLLWYTSATATVGSTTAPTPNTSTVGTTTYYVSQTISNCESNRTAITVTINPLPTTPTVTPNGTVLICNNQPTTLSTTSTSVLQWFKDGIALSGQNSNSLSVNQSGNYTVQTTNNTGCSSTSLAVSVANVASPSIVIGSDKIVKATDSVRLTPTVSGGNLFTYTWSPATYLSNTNIINPWVVKPQTNMTYKLVVTNNNGCKDSSSIKIQVLKDLFIPNAFSPNGDGINETWDISGLNLYPSCVVEIFNRNGQIVYRSVGYTRNWDGTRNGKPLPVGVYYYVIDTKQNNKVYTGWISILR